MAQIDFSPLGDLFNVYRQAQMQTARQNSPLLAPYGGDIGLYQLATQAQRDTRDFGLREKQFDLAKRQADATLEGSKVPAGFKQTAGGLAPIVGGPADPAYIQATTDAKDKGRHMSVNDITKLSEEGGKFSAVKGFVDTFQDKFAGQTAFGDARNFVGRNFPDWATDPDARESAAWWQNYDRYKNVVRNELFGSALTKPEQDAFMRADITPNMKPELVKSNLAEQQKVLGEAMRRRAGALVSEGFNAESVARGFGVKLQDLGIEPKKKAADKPPAWNNRDTIAAARANPQATLEEARKAIASGKDPAAVKQRLQQVGIDPSGL